MNTNTIDAELCAKMFLAGARNLESKKEWINELNVFPVPDGDTGTNMTLTIMSAVREVSELESLTMASFAKAVSSGSLRGARGNSGVILSQLLRGFTKVIRTEEEITPAVLTASLQKAVETAYKAVMKPKEGTILTVAKGAAERAVELLEENPDIDLETLMQEVVERSEEVLEQTPELLPVLKEAGVVDSGGQGLVQILKGALDAYRGIEIPMNAVAENTRENIEDNGVRDVDKHQEDETPAEKMPQFDYCMEFAILPENEDSEVIRSRMNAFWERTGVKTISNSNLENAVAFLLDETYSGNSLQDEKIKVHIHTNDPGRVFQNAELVGELAEIRIKNLRLERCEHVAWTMSPGEEDQTEAQTEMRETQGNDSADPFALPGIPKITELKETGFISVSIGDGIADIFRDLGVDCLIEGGQTMNPSTEDMLNAIGQVNAKNIFILPNNKNIIMAANQAKSLTKDKNIFVIPTRTVPQGITAVINYVPEKTPQENAIVMEEEIESVRTGQLTYAVRDTHIENMVISAGDIMGVGDHSILAVGKEIDSVAVQTVEKMMTDDAELISIYYGEDMKETEAQAFCDQITELYPNCDVELNYGGQPIYYYIISVE